MQSEFQQFREKSIWLHRFCICYRLRRCGTLLLCGLDPEDVRDWMLRQPFRDVGIEYFVFIVQQRAEESHPPLADTPFVGQPSPFLVTDALSFDLLPLIQLHRFDVLKESVLVSHTNCFSNSTTCISYTKIVCPRVPVLCTACPGLLAVLVAKVQAQYPTLDMCLVSRVCLPQPLMDLWSPYLMTCISNTKIVRPWLPVFRTSPISARISLQRYKQSTSRSTCAVFRECNRCNSLCTLISLQPHPR